MSSALEGCLLPLEGVRWVVERRPLVLCSRKGWEGRGRGVPVSSALEACLLLPAGVRGVGWVGWGVGRRGVPASAAHEADILPPGYRGSFPGQVS